MVRHGECIANTPRKIPGKHTWGKMNFLTLKGYKQAELCGVELDERELTEWDHIYTSDMVRAQQTCSVILQTLDIHDKHEVTITDTLDEWWDNPKGKTSDEFHEQVDQFMQTYLMPKWDSDESILVVSHGHTTRCMIDLIHCIEDPTRSWTNIHDVRYHVPNAMPIFYDTKSPEPIKYTVPGLHRVHYA